MKGINLKSSAKNFLLQQKALVALALMLLLMLFFPTNFYSVYNILDILNSSAVTIILACGVTITVISGACDLSIGGILTVAGILAVQMVNAGLPIIVAVILTLLFGAFVGFVNGFFVVHQKTEPFIITLGMGITLTGLAQQLTDARPVSAKVIDFSLISLTNIFMNFSTLILICLIVIILSHMLMRHSKFGRDCYAIGGDYQVALYSGINVIKTKWISFILCGVLSALAGIMLSSKVNSGSSVYGANSAMLVNCGVVVGGVSFSGGIGNIPKAVLGLLVFGVLDNVLNMLGVTSYLQILIKGVMIVAIIWMDSYTIKRKREDV